MNKKNVKISFELVFRQCVFLILNVYAIRKMFGGQFYMNGELPTEVANITLGKIDSFTLAWAFMGHSYYYVMFIGITQLIGAWFLLWNKTKLLGVMILTPIMLNIIMFDLIFLGVYSALAMSIIIFTMLFLIVNLNKEKVTQAFNSLTSFQSKPKVRFKSRILTIGISILTLIFIFIICYLIEMKTWIA
jgi:hypothetical protein